MLVSLVRCEPVSVAFCLTLLFLLPYALEAHYYCETLKRYRNQCRQPVFEVQSSLSAASMFTQPTPSPPILGSSPSLASATSPTRPSRLRGLSYLRNYTQNHLHSRDTNAESTTSRRHSLSRSTSFPTPTPTPFGFGGSNNSGAHVDLSSPTREHRIQGDQEDRATREQSGTSQTTSSGPAASRNEDPRSAAMGRTRSATTSRAAGADSSHNSPMLNGSAPAPSSYVPNANGSETGQNQLPSIRFSQHQDVRAPRPSLVFSAMSRTLPTGNETIRVGRYSERENGPTVATAPNVPSSAPIGFKSKVVSRRHCEFWFQDGAWFIKDVKSSSGTFLNHVRLSSPGSESKPYPIKDGDIVQLGIDFKGGEEMIFRCVKIRVELNRGWQNALNSFK